MPPATREFGVVARADFRQNLSGWIAAVIASAARPWGPHELAAVAFAAGS
ncbi:MAG TPA: hypothetical protein VK427_24940 [Kofleriaceae bacterium]|nr:hypothetical protein [Kofleriaceae bacterium]